ncbi:hypothetical protein QTG54_008466 [Skeletonema marinoi]|uniref:Uncharacterized protein n=1 Tax=Skeletonema marinoi TaxID=267567 RepID=A0AAD8Y8Y9_9STRA|nr:hypothetical protein QTG54_008466 [Skeletonema marinoi]
MMSRTKCNRLLGYAIITIAIALELHNNNSSAAVVSAFAPPSLFAARNQSIQPRKPTSIITSDVCSSIKLFGLANVNDYFDSFRRDENNNDEHVDDGTSSSLNDGRNENDLKYIGHGRISASADNAANNGAFDVNNYFSSFGSQSGSSSSSDDTTTAQYGEEEQTIDDGSSYTSFDTAQQQQQQPPPSPKKKMTHSQIIAYNNSRLCPKSFLTQSSIQSFIYLLEECRDPHSGKWIQDFLHVQNLGNFHGTGAFNVQTYPTWDSVLIDILRQPNQKMIVSAKRRGRGHGGWSKNNPYLQERWVEFKIDIRPASLVQRLLSVRQQLAVEFERDLEIVGMVDGMIIESYFSTMKREREEQQQQQQPWDDKNKQDGGQVADMITPPMNDENGRAFDRISVNILSNFTEFASSGSASSSPFRKGNFDLLYNLCTQASVHRLLRDLRESKVDSVSYQWLQKFYSERVSEYFDGDQAFGRADDFIDTLLRSPPSLVSMDDGRSLGLTDPLRIAERIIAKRSEVAHEWIGMMKEVKADHLVLNELVVRVMMGKAIDASEDNNEVTIEEETTWEPLGDDAGVFE